MVRILRGGRNGKVTLSGPFKTSSINTGSGPRVPKDTAGRFSVRRLFAGDPADGDFANIGTQQDAIEVLGKTKVAVAATLTTALAGADNDLTYTAKVAGTVGNSTRVRYVVSGLNTAFSVSVSSADITVNLATDGAGVATSTANAILAGIQASAPASALVSVALATGNNGTGVAVALGFTNLSGGTQATTPQDGATNTTGPQNPSISKAPNLKKGNAEPVGRTHVVSRSTNRRIRTR